ncbi:asparagine synthase (glutamine-hydrolyzing) [Pyrococcus yayanosii]|nr:asparagine synthase (glutamine-hydrolyzing) [Pyrococcus yayanosii]
MCLVVGGLHLGREKLVRMMLTGKHRGPDSFGVWADGSVFKSSNFSDLDDVPSGKIVLAQCRLAMTGSKDFTQPFYNDLVLVHNGEIYNHIQLRAYLVERGHSFESDVDSEVILKLLEHLLFDKGLSVEEAVRKAMLMLNGDYAVAFFDGQRIYLFRDPLGIRPLYYSPNGFFASEKKVLWAIGEEAIPVRPGELVEVAEGGIKRFQLVNPLSFSGKLFTEERALKGILNVLPHATRIRTTKRTGVLFSGGLDSSLIALLAARYSDITLYAAGTEDSPDIEGARRVADELGLPLKEFIFTREDVEEALPKVAFAIEEPNAVNLAIAIPIYFATLLAREDGVKVLLSGQGADELFGGYAKYLQRPELMERDILEMGERNLARDDKVSMLNGVEVRYPYLDPAVVRVAIRTPLELKIKEGIRKLILRRAAEQLGLPREVAWKEKKACQYGSRSQKLLEKIAKARGTTLRGLAEMLFSETFQRSTA